MAVGTVEGDEGVAPVFVRVIIGVSHANITGAAGGIAYETRKILPRSKPIARRNIDVDGIHDISAAEMIKCSGDNDIAIWLQDVSMKEVSSPPFISKRAMPIRRVSL